ncbi:MAG: hypothetical protein HQK66_10430 [Desulfamplus sp.]|nr:hypothetical protein [Desulfamplus sp.]
MCSKPIWHITYRSSCQAKILPGQDGNYIINPRSYTKLDDQGNDLPITATSWTMVRDNVTGLIWEVKTRDGSIHDRDNGCRLRSGGGG